MMRGLQVTVFVLAVLVLTTQAVRHFYVRYLEPRISVLDKYEQTDTEKAIREATSLSELVTQYDSAKKRVNGLDKQRKEAETNKTKDERDVLRDKFKEEHKEEYEREKDLKRAIEDWEQKSKEIHELRVFWIFGLVLFLIGSVLLKVGQYWPGMSFTIPGIVEMIWWTSPPFRFVGSAQEFDWLLINKLVFTLVTLFLVVFTWYFNQFRNRSGKEEQS